MSIRLLHTRDLTFHKFRVADFSKVPKYAILSHVWNADDEHVNLVSFTATFRNGIPPMGKLNSGFQKIVHFCRQAATDGFQYAWADTCCIDKSNDSETAEAINSMFRWYKESTHCYAYLVDVPANDQISRPGSAFRRSRWFTRGWTLQELIAPKSLVFYSQEWKPINTKAALKDTISNVTGIDEYVLVSGDVSNASVAMKLSWAATRTTTIVEDQAYCLLGIFDISMPLIYGEREEALQRLMREIASYDSDQTIFSWAGDGRPSGMFATSPSQFLPAKDASLTFPAMRNPAFELTNRGLEISLPLIELPLRNTYAMVLNCLPPSTPGAAPNRFLVQFIYRVHDDYNDYVRVLNNVVATCPEAFKVTHLSRLTPSKVYIGPPRTRHFEMNRSVMICLRKYPFKSSHPKVSALGPPSTLSKFATLPQRPGQAPLVTMQLDDQMPSVVLLFRNKSGRQIAACLTLWGHDIKVGLATDLDNNEDVTHAADAFLFGQRPMVIKRPGTFAARSSPRGGKKVTFLVEEPFDDAAAGTVCDVSLDATDDYWLHAIGPGLLPGCWTRYFDFLSKAKPPVQKRTLSLRR